MNRIVSASGIAEYMDLAIGFKCPDRFQSARTRAHNRLHPVGSIQLDKVRLAQYRIDHKLLALVGDQITCRLKFRATLHRENVSDFEMAPRAQGLGDPRRRIFGNCSKIAKRFFVNAGLRV